MEYAILTSKYGIDQRQAEIRIENLSLEKDYLKIYLSDRRIVSIPEDWFKSTGFSSIDLVEDCQISPDGSAICWNDDQYILTLQNILSGSDPCDRCWYRLAFYQ